VRASATELEGVMLFEPVCHQDARGLLVETFKEPPIGDAARRRLRPGQSVALAAERSSRAHQRRQGKLITVVQGEIQDIAVDIRRTEELRTLGASAAFGRGPSA
jgi:dTDP-4-dehydrorhamnose 3,5-epimerase